MASANEENLARFGNTVDLQLNDECARKEEVEEEECGGACFCP
jgi:hypothetical protein